ncbi:MAG: CBS and ACT domain-containing protein [Bacillota bacterium]
MFVRNKMTTHPFIISPDQTIPDAHEIMAKHGVRRLPVVKNGKLVGVVSREDIAHASPSKATALSFGELNYLLAKTKISQVMVRDPLTISPDALLEEAAIAMRDHEIGFLPVVQDDRLVGVITESNIFDAFTELLGMRDAGTRLTIEAEDMPGIMASIARIFAEFDVNITHVAVYRGSSGKSAVVVGIQSYNTEDIEKTIENQGFKIIRKQQNR